MTRKIVAAACLLALLGGGRADAGEWGPLPAQAKYRGVTLGEWTAPWWPWAFATGFAPLFDGPCDAGQAGPVWYLAGNFGGTSVRTCAVPHAKALLVPVVNVLWASTVPDFEPWDAAGIEPLVDIMFAGATGTLEVDGVPVDLAAYDVTSPLFFLPGAIAGVDFPLPALTRGYYVMLPPMDAGPHTLRFTGFLPALPADACAPFSCGRDATSLDVTYTLVAR